MGPLLLKMARTVFCFRLSFMAGVASSVFGLSTGHLSARPTLVGYRFHLLKEWNRAHRPCLQTSIGAGHFGSRNAGRSIMHHCSLDDERLGTPLASTRPPPRPYTRHRHTVYMPYARCGHDFDFTLRLPLDRPRNVSLECRPVVPPI